MKRPQLLLLVAFFCGSALAAKTIEVHDPWVREAPPGAQVMAGYMKLANPLESDQTLVSARAEGFADVELHETVIEAGKATMRPVPSLKVPARGEIVLKQGSYHLMLMRPEHPFRAGDEIKIDLRLANGTVVRVHAPVRVAHTPGHMH